MPFFASTGAEPTSLFGLLGKLICGIAALGMVAAVTQASASTPGPHLLKPSGLHCEGKSEPLAIASSHPSLSWQLAPSSVTLHGVSQSAYRLQVAEAGRGLASAHDLVWDSGIVRSSATAGIVYAGPTLEPRQMYRWRVEVWDEKGQPSGWSKEGHWTQAPEWHAGWIAAYVPEHGIDNAPMPLFRKAFSVSHRIARAMLYASGLGQDELRINGKKVGNDELTPGWSDYRRTVYYDAYDVTALLTQGPNALGVMLGNGMYRVLKTPGRFTKFVGSFGEPKCSVQLEIDFSDGNSMEILSDGTWKTAPGPITFSSTYGGEDFDARLEPRGWDRAGFDDSAWSAVSVVAGPGGALMPEIAPPIEVMHTYSPVKITHPKPGVTVYDLGQNFAGWPEIAVTGRAGTVVKMIPGELLNQDGLVWQRSSGGPQWFSYTLRGAGVETWHPRFSYYGFRYVQVGDVATDAPVGAPEDTARILSLRGEAIHSSSPQVGEFASSDDLLNRIHLLILHAIQNNAESLFTDCPHREKLGWLEETHLMAPSILYDFDFAGLYTATARNIADAQRREGPKAGMVPEIAPQYVVFDPAKFDVFNDSPEWGSAAVLAPWHVYERTGDRAFLAAQFDVMRRYVDYLGTRARDGIIDYGLGDWYDIGPGDPGFSKLTTAGVTGTAIYYQDLKTLEKTAAVLGMKIESEAYARRAENVRADFNARFFDTALQMYDKGSQTAQAMPLALGMAPPGEREAVLDKLVADIRAHENHTTSGEVGFHYAVDALLEGGRSDVLLDMLERTDAPSYGYILSQGATSLTEGWDASHSQDHFMLGSAEEWFYRGLGGITVDLSRQGADRLVIRPVVPAQIAWARTHYQSALGMIVSNWKRDTAHTEYDIEIPVDTTATITIESARPGAVSVNGVATAKCSGVLGVVLQGGRAEMTLPAGPEGWPQGGPKASGSAHVDANRIELTVGSGTYHIRAENPAR